MSKKVLGWSFVSGAGIAITIDPLLMLSAKSLNDEFLKTSVTLDKIKGLRKSGLSFPYYPTHSSNGIFLKGGFEI